MKYIIILMLSVVCFAETELEKKYGRYQVNTLKDVSIFNKIKEKNKKGSINNKLLETIVSLESIKHPAMEVISTKEKWQNLAKLLEKKLPEIDFDKHVIAVYVKDKNDPNSLIGRVSYNKGKFSYSGLSTQMGFSSAGIYVIKLKKLPRLK